MTGRRIALSAVGALLMLAGCSAGPLPEPLPVVSATVPRPGGAAVTTPTNPAAPDCGDPTASLRPGPLPQPGSMPAGTFMRRIADKGYLTVGVNQNTYRMGFRDPFSVNGEIQGFDIDMARHVAAAIFGSADPQRLRLRALSSEQRIPALEKGEVDIVVNTMTINCDRLKQVGFSSVYYEAKQKVLVRKDSGVQGMDGLGGRPVCAARGSTSLVNIANAPAKPIPIGVADWTDCLVMLQQGQVDGVSTDDVILAGLKAQDQFTEMVGPMISNEPYGMAVPLNSDDFVRFVNGVIAEVKASGKWAASYQAWLGSLIPGGIPAPPQPRYRD